MLDLDLVQPNNRNYHHTSYDTTLYIWLCCKKRDDGSDCHTLYSTTKTLLI